MIVGDHSEPEFHSCIRYESATYFLHGGAKDALNSKEKKGLVAFLRKPYERRPVISNWERIVDQWVDNNPNVPLDSNLEMPDYTQLR